jgi:hypothetical protein
MLYEGATARVHLNGTTVGHIPNQCGVRQGCPLSMTLYALCLHPFVRRLHDSLVGIKIGRQTVRTKVIAYADDVNVFVTNPGELAAFQHAVLLFEKATGAKLNPRKSKALAVGPWSTPVTELIIDTYERVKILGYTFGKTIAESCNRHWATVIAAVRAQTYNMYQRNLNIEQRVQFVNVYHFAKLWFAARVLPPPQRTAHPTDECNWCLVHLEGSHLSGSTHHPHSPKTTRRLGSTRPGGEM